MWRAPSAIRRFDRKAHSVAGRKYNTTAANNTNAKNGRDRTKASTTYKTAAIAAAIIVELEAFVYLVQPSEKQVNTTMTDEKRR